MYEAESRKYLKNISETATMFRWILWVHIITVAVIFFCKILVGND